MVVQTPPSSAPPMERGLLAPAPVQTPSPRHSMALPGTREGIRKLHRNKLPWSSPWLSASCCTLFHTSCCCCAAMGYGVISCSFVVGRRTLHSFLRWPPTRNANRGDSGELIHANRFAEKSLVSWRSSDSGESPQIWDSQFFVPRNAIRQKEVRVRNPEMIPVNRLICESIRTNWSI